MAAHIRTLEINQIADPQRGQFIVRPFWNHKLRCWVAPADQDGRPTRDDALHFRIRGEEAR